MYLVQYSTSSAIKNKVWITRDFKSKAAARAFVSQLVLQDGEQGIHRGIRMLGKDVRHERKTE